MGAIDFGLGWSGAGLAVSCLGIVLAVWLSGVAAQRVKQKRWRAAKAMLVRDLGPSLREARSAELPALGATIRSVLRANGLRTVDAVALEELTDDLLRQITADPFLDHERRAQLQQQTLDLAAQASAQVAVQAGRDAGEGLLPASAERGARAGWLGDGPGLAVGLVLLFGLLTAATFLLLQSAGMTAYGAALAVGSLAVAAMAVGLVFFLYVLVRLTAAARWTGRRWLGLPDQKGHA